MFTLRYSLRIGISIFTVRYPKTFCKTVCPLQALPLKGHDLSFGRICRIHPEHNTAFSKFRISIFRHILTYCERFHSYSFLLAYGNGSRSLAFTGTGYDGHSRCTRTIRGILRQSGECNLVFCFAYGKPCGAITFNGYRIRTLIRSYGRLCRGTGFTGQSNLGRGNGQCGRFFGELIVTYHFHGTYEAACTCLGTKVKSILTETDVSCFLPIFTFRTCPVAFTIARISRCIYNSSTQIGQVLVEHGTGCLFRIADTGRHCIGECRVFMPDTIVCVKQIEQFIGCR